MKTFLNAPNFKNLVVALLIFLSASSAIANLCNQNLDLIGTNWRTAGSLVAVCARTDIPLSEKQKSWVVLQEVLETLDRAGKLCLTTCKDNLEAYDYCEDVIDNVPSYYQGAYEVCHK